MKQSTAVQLTSSQRLDVITARAWNRTLRRLKRTRTHGAWNRMDLLTVQALRLYVRLVTDTGAPVQVSLPWDAIDALREGADKT